MEIKVTLTVEEVRSIIEILRKEQMATQGNREVQEAIYWKLADAYTLAQGEDLPEHTR